MSRGAVLRLVQAVTVAERVDAENEVERSRQLVGRSAACGGEIEAEVLVARDMEAHMAAVSFRQERLRLPARRVDERSEKSVP